MKLKCKEDNEVYDVNLYSHLNEIVLTYWAGGEKVSCTYSSLGEILGCWEEIR